MTIKLKHLCLALALVSLPIPSLAASTTVLASLPVTHTLASALLDGTAIKLQRAAPTNIPASRQPSYFSGRGGPSLQKAASQADAVIALRSIWSDDPLYPMSRRSNIRIVEIDAARPVDGALPGIAVHGNDTFAAYPWLNPSNFGRMADVLANDLGRLSPSEQSKIQANLASLKRQLLELSATSESRLAEADNLSVINLSERLGYLVSGLNLDLIDHPPVADDQWNTAALNRLSDELKRQDVALVLHHKQPSKDVADVIAGTGAKLVVIETDPQDTLAGLKVGIDQIVAALTTS